jgi:hypothetical protein
MAPGRGSLDSNRQSFGFVVAVKFFDDDSVDFSE